MHWVPSLRGFPSFAFKTVPVIIWLTMALPRPFKRALPALPLSTPFSSRRSVVRCTSLALCPLVVVQASQNFQSIYPRQWILVFVCVCGWKHCGVHWWCIINIVKSVLWRRRRRRRRRNTNKTKQTNTTTTTNNNGNNNNNNNNNKNNNNNNSNNNKRKKERKKEGSVCAGPVN